MCQILATLWLEYIAMIGVGLIVYFLERMHLGQMADGPSGVGIRKPDAITDAESRVAIDRDAKSSPEELFSDHLADRFVFLFHVAGQWSAIPGQAGTQALSAEHEGYFFFSFQRRVSHQVNSVRIGPGAAPHSAWIDDGHEDQANRFELPVENAIPGQSANQAAQVSQDNVGSDSLKAMKATKKTNNGNVGIRISQGDNMHRKLPCADGNLTGYMSLKLASAISNNGFQFEQFIEF